MFHSLSVIFLIISCLAWEGMSVQRDVFSTNTVYEWARDVETMPAEDGGITTAYNLSSCTAIHVHGVIRHGTRNPKVADIKKINALYRKLIANKNSTRFPDMASVQTDHVYKMETGGEMIKEGLEEMKELGRRYGKMFSRLLNNKNNNIQFRASSVKRTQYSSLAFFAGLSDVLDNVNSNLTDYNGYIDDTTIRFWEDCYKFDREVKKNQTNFIQFKQYDNTSEFQAVIDSVKAKLGLKIPVLSEDLYQMYDLCAYEMYVYNDTRWCDLMSDEDRTIIEYGKDIKHYYGWSYGNPMNSQLACPLVKDIFQTLDSAIDNTSNYSQSGQFNHTKEYVPGKFQNGHFETIVPLLTSLGLFKDEDHLLATNRVAMASRKFRSSHISPYAANIVLALYACDDANNTMVVRMLVNEDPVVIPVCGKYICPYEQVKAYYKEQLDQCDMKRMCGTDPSGSPSTTYSLILMVACFVLYMI